MSEKYKIVAIGTQNAQIITGQVRGHVNADKAGVTLTYDGPEMPGGKEGIDRGIWIKGKGTNLLIPYANICGVYVQVEGDDKIVVGAK